METSIRNKFNSIKNLVDALLFGNPSFEYEFNYICNNLYNGIDSDYSIVVSNDMKKISFEACGESLKNSSSLYYSAFYIYLDGLNMIVEHERGGFYSKDDFSRLGIIRNNNSLNLYYRKMIFDSNGINLETCWYQDNVDFDTLITCDSIKEKVHNRFHKPIFVNRNMPIMPMFYQNASCMLEYRIYDNLGLVYVNLKTNIVKEQPYIQDNGLYLNETDNPFIISILPKRVGTIDNDTYSMDTNIYGDNSFRDISLSIKKQFYSGIDNSDLKLYNPDMYQRIMSTSNYY